MKHNVYTVKEELARNDAWVERALVVLYHRQTAIEQASRTTYNKNEVGFQVADAKEFSGYAKQLLTGKHLSEAQLARTRRPWHRGSFPQPTICKYAGQILEVIREREERR